MIGYWEKIDRTIGVEPGAIVNRGQVWRPGLCFLGQVAKGIDPRAERLRLKAEEDRERAEAALSFEALVDEWAQLHLAHRRERYREEAQRAIKYIFADFLKRPAACIARADIINVLDKLGAKAVTAARSLAYARAAFNWAAKRERVPHNPFVGLPVATVEVAPEF